MHRWFLRESLENVTESRALEDEEEALVVWDLRVKLYPDLRRWRCTRRWAFGTGDLHRSF